MTDLANIKEAVIKGKSKEIGALVQTALDEGADPQDIINNYLIDAMKEVGARFEAKKIFVPEMMIAARTMQTGLAVIEPLIEGDKLQLEKLGTVVVGTVFGDLHDIGKNLVRMMLEGGGFEAIDLGVDVSPSAFVDAVREHEPDLVGISALLTTTMAQMKVTIEALEEAGLRDSIKIMVGGAPVTADFAEQIGADAYAPDAASAVDVARELQA